MSSKQTFVDACLSGRALLTEVDDYVSAWHDCEDDTRDLHEFLGMTADEYRLWVERPESLRFILAAHKNRMPVTELVLEQTGLMAAARAEAKDEAVHVLRWLIKTGRVSDPDA
ncbi:hypothetical protein [Micromonospora sp. NPDC049891]|uniref:hypothetical protein n=1 Tax=Micromonospora sp. NPDC049891 TaxID=3155655 RepID=UPI0033CA15C7